MGETDRLVTVLTIERGLIRVIVPGARKHKSRLGGRSSQFVVNELFVIQGKSLDKLVQAETVRSFPGLSADLARLTASQYLAELVLCQALSEQPQGELFALLIEQLQRLEHATGDEILALLSQGIVRLLTFAGVAPELEHCSVSRTIIEPKAAESGWQVGFSAVSGGVVSLEQIGQQSLSAFRARMPAGQYAVNGGNGGRTGSGRSPKVPPTTLISAAELLLLRRLHASEPINPEAIALEAEAVRLLWQRIERLLRQYAEYHFDRPIRSATLIDACFPAAVPAK